MLLIAPLELKSHRLTGDHITDNGFQPRLLKIDNPGSAKFQLRATHVRAPPLIPISRIDVAVVVVHQLEVDGQLDGGLRHYFLNGV